MDNAQDCNIGSAAGLEDAPVSALAEANVPASVLDGRAGKGADALAKADAPANGSAIASAEPERRTIFIVHASVGSGHKSAARAIDAALELVDDDGQCYDTEVLDILDFGRIIFDGDSTASMFTGATRPIYDLTWRYTLTGRLLWGGGTIWAHVMFPKFVEYVRQKRPAAIVCTHITAANCAVSARMILDESFPIVCVPTDYEVEGLWPHLYTDLFCVANEHMAETLRARKVPESRMQITGIPANPEFSLTFDRQKVRSDFGLASDKQVVLFLAGAMLPRPYVHFRSAISELLPYVHKYAGMQMVIVTGSDAEYAERLRREVADLGLDNVVVLGYVNEMAALMSAADLIVCKSGGLTVTECLCVGTPMILIGRAYGQEKANVTMLTASGSSYHVTTARELRELLNQISKHPEMTRTIQANAAIIKRPNAAMDIARATIELIHAERPVADPLLRKRFMRFYIGHRPAHTR